MIQNNEKCWLCDGTIFGRFDTRILILSKRTYRICSTCADKLKCKPFKSRPSYESYENAVFNGEAY